MALKSEKESSAKGKKHESLKFLVERSGYKSHKENLITEERVVFAFR